MNRFFRSILQETLQCQQKALTQQNKDVCTGTGSLMKGCLDMYQVTNDMFYKDYILNYADKLIDSKGKIKGYENGSFTAEVMELGSTLIWVCQETGEEKYKLAADSLRDRVREFDVRCEDDKHFDEMERSMKSIYYVQPFYMEYETKYENKECYLDIMTQFRNARKYLFNSTQAMTHLENDEAKPKNIGRNGEDSSPCETVARYLMALIETLDKMSIEIFEHYKLLEQYFKEALKEVLALRGKESSLPNEPDEYFDKESLLMAQYSVMKACQMKIILSEKYYETAEHSAVKLLKDFYEKYQNLESDVTKDELWNNRRMVGILMMTYSQYMIGNKTKNIKELGCCYEQ